MVGESKVFFLVLDILGQFVQVRHEVGMAIDLA
jgi:hypothetical protein